MRLLRALLLRWLVAKDAVASPTSDQIYLVSKKHKRFVGDEKAEEIERLFPVEKLPPADVEAEAESSDSGDD